MKPKHIFVAIAALVAAGGLWLGRSTWRAHAIQNSSMGVGVKMPQGSHIYPNSGGAVAGAFQTGPALGPNNRAKSGHMLQPPAPYRRFTDFTPEQRVQFARQGHGPGG